MTGSSKPALKDVIRRYGLAVVSVATALVITKSLERYTDITPLFYAAVVITAWFGGMGPGLVAVALATFSLEFFFVPPLYTFDLGVKDVSFIVVFGFLAVLSSWMSAKRKQAEKALTEARDELELRVQERTADLRQANESLRREMAERHRTEEALQESRTALAHVTRVATLGEMTASIAHEINQPLAAVVTNGNATLRWLGTQPPNLDEVRQAVGRIIKDGNRASEVIRRIRALVKKTAPRRDTVDLNDVIKEVIALASSELRRNGITVTSELPDNSLYVVGDRVQLQQVILNLIMNGIESMSGLNEGSRTLLITSANDSNEVTVRVCDSGVGVDSANLDQLFDAFFTTKPEGMGMGLAISRSIIEAHGGRLSASANSPQGSVFQFTLPEQRTA